MTMSLDITKTGTTSSSSQGITHVVDSISLSQTIDEKENDADIVYTTKRGLKARHVQFIALGGAIGTGLFVGSGSALSTCGPGSLLIAYLIICFLVWLIMNQLGEMITYLPLVGQSTVYALCSRYTGNKSLSFAAGLNIFYAQIITASAEITATAFIIQYWNDSINIALWISIFYALMVLINFLGVQYFGEVEFWISSIKILCIVGLIITGLVIFFGGAPNSHGILGFHYWKDPGTFTQHLVPGSTGRFLSIYTAIIKSSFSFILSPELITSCASESENPRKNLPKATDRFIYRLLAFYIMGILVIGVIVAYNDPRLMSAISSSNGMNAQASPFVIGIQNAGIKVLNHIINACILTSAFSAGNSFIFSGSRTLYSMAMNGDLPHWFTRCNKYGVPYYCVLVSVLICSISYLNVSNSAATVFTWLSNIATISGYLDWIIISITYLRFTKAIEFHGLSHRITYRPPLQKIGCYLTIFMFSLLSLTNGYAVFFHFKASDFIAAYITLPVFLVLYLGHMFYYRNFKLFTPVEQIDVWTGLDEIEYESHQYEILNSDGGSKKTNLLQKMWDWLC